MFQKPITPYTVQPLQFLPWDHHIPAVVSDLTGYIHSGHPELVIDHIGSTAVYDMPGKNIINLIIPIEQAKFPEILHYLEELGFSEHPYKKEPDYRPLRVGNYTYKGKVYGVHVHLTPLASDEHKSALFFPQYLREHPEARVEYAQIKHDAVKNHPDDFEYYANAKDPFIHKILDLQN